MFSDAIYIFCLVRCFVVGAVLVFFWGFVWFRLFVGFSPCFFPFSLHWGFAACPLGRAAAPSALPYSLLIARQRRHRPFNDSFSLAGLRLPPHGWWWEQVRSDSATNSNLKSSSRGVQLPGPAEAANPSKHPDAPAVLETGSVKIELSTRLSLASGRTRAPISEPLWQSRRRCGCFAGRFLCAVNWEQGGEATVKLHWELDFSF